jgi:hypothetical protein
MANMTQINVRLPPELLAAVDRVCGDVPRNRWLVALLERTVGDSVVEAMPSEAKGAWPIERAGPVPVPSGSTMLAERREQESASTGSEGVRPAVSPPAHLTDMGGRQPVTTMGSGDAERTESNARKPMRDDDEALTSRTHGDHLSRQQRLNAEKAGRTRPKKRKS